MYTGLHINSVLESRMTSHFSHHPNTKIIVVKQTYLTRVLPSVLIICIKSNKRKELCDWKHLPRPSPNFKCYIALKK